MYFGKVFPSPGLACDCTNLNKAEPPLGTESLSKEAYMRTSFYVFALAPVLLAGCAGEPTTVTTTTTTQEVTTAGPAMRPVTREVLVTQAPPVVRVEAQTISPGPGYVWTRGYWRWTGAGYEWMPGTWVIRPNPGTVWVEGHWLRRSGGWVWVAGHWR